MTTSIHTNTSAMIALQNLNRTNDQLAATQGRVSTGLKVQGAKDNAAVWAVAQGQRVGQPFEGEVLAIAVGEDHRRGCGASGDFGWHGGNGWAFRNQQLLAHQRALVLGQRR